MNNEHHPFDPAVRRYFMKIVVTLFMGLLWMMVNIFLGIVLGLAIPEETSTLWLIVFYAWFALSLLAGIYGAWRLWRKREQIRI